MHMSFYLSRCSREHDCDLTKYKIKGRNINIENFSKNWKMLVNFNLRKSFF